MLISIFLITNILNAIRSSGSNIQANRVVNFGENDMPGFLLVRAKCLTHLKKNTQTIVDI